MWHVLVRPQWKFKPLKLMVESPHAIYGFCNGFFVKDYVNIANQINFYSLSSTVNGRQNTNGHRIMKLLSSYYTKATKIHKTF